MRRLTQQKKILYDAVKDFTSFFSAAELKKEHPKIGLATIYRFLNCLENDGEIHSFLCENTKVYSNSKTSHAHFKCEKCGEIKHFSIKNVDFLNEIVAEEVCHFQLELVGRCESCRTN